MIRMLGLCVLATLLSGCGGWWGGDEEIVPPSPLKSITNPIPIELRWDSRVGAGADKSFVRIMPIFADGKLFVASRDGVVMALDAQNGTTLWTQKTSWPISGGVGFSDSGLLLIGTLKGEVVALNASDGQTRWQAKVSGEVLAPPRAQGHTVVVRSGDGKITAFDAQTGERRWVHATLTPVLEVRGFSPPLLTRDLALVGLDTGKLLVLSLEKGLPLTEKSIAIPHGRTDIERLTDMDGELRLFEETLYLAAYQGRVAAMNLRSGELTWSRPISSQAGLAVDAQRVYISEAQDAVVALDRKSGGVLWKQSELIGRRLSAPVVTEDHVIVGDFEGYLHWLDKETGAIVARARAARKDIVASPVVVGSTVFAQGQDGMISALRVNP